MNAIHEFQSRGKEYKVAGTAEGGRFRLLARSPTSGFFETVAYSDQESIQADMLAELARLATQKAENLPDGSREFEHRGQRWKIKLNPGRLLELRESGGYLLAGLHTPGVPPFEVLAEQFAALGREQGFREKVQILPAAAAIIRSIEEERDRARDDARDTFRDLNAARERIATLERDCDTWRDGCAVDQRDLAAARERIAELDQREEDSRAEVADLSRRLEAQKARADVQERRAIDYSGSYAKAVEGLQGSAGTIKALRGRLAVLEGELVAAKTMAGRARTEGDPRRIVQIAADSLGPLALAADGTAWFRVGRGDGYAWGPLPPLPPIEPAKAGAEECEPAPPALARHDWHTHRGHVSCERCGAPFGEGREAQACGAQP